MIESHPSHHGRPLNIFTPTQEAFRRLFMIAERNRKARFHRELAHEHEQLETKDWVPAISSHINARGIQARERGESILDAVAAYEAYASTDTTEQKLSRYEALLQLLVHPDVDRAMHVANEALDREGIHGVILFPIGSAASGGMIVRDLSGSFHTGGQDIDMMVYSSSQIQPDITRVQAIIESAIKEVPSTIYPYQPVHFVGDRHGLFVAQHRNFPTISEHDIVIGLQANDLDWQLCRTLFHCFGASYPPAYAAMVRRKTLESLQALHVKDPAKWQERIKQLAAVLSSYDIVLVKEKHVHDGGDMSHGEVSYAVNKTLVKVREDMLTDLLFSTAV